MEPNNHDQRKTSIKIPLGPWGTFEVRGLGTILTLILVVLILTMYVLYKHTEHAANSEQRMINALQNVAVSVREVACINSLGNKREQREAFKNGSCREIARIGSGYGRDF